MFGSIAAPLGLLNELLGQQQVGQAPQPFNGAMGAAPGVGVGMPGGAGMPGMGASQAVQGAEKQAPQGPPGFFDTFFGSMDKTFESPSKLLGIGLLNQIGYPLGTGALVGKGLLDAFRR